MILLWQKIIKALHYDDRVRIKSCRSISYYPYQIQILFLNLHILYCRIATYISESVCVHVAIINYSVITIITYNYCSYTSLDYLGATSTQEF